jgi:hypothetical protein
MYMCEMQAAPHPTNPKLEYSMRAGNVCHDGREFISMLCPLPELSFLCIHGVILDELCLLQWAV